MEIINRDLTPITSPQVLPRRPGKSRVKARAHLSGHVSLNTNKTSSVHTKILERMF